MMVDRRQWVAIKITMNFGDLLELTLGDREAEHEQLNRNHLRRSSLAEFEMRPMCDQCELVSLSPQNPLHVH